MRQACLEQFDAGTAVDGGGTANPQGGVGALLPRKAREPEWVFTIVLTRAAVAKDWEVRRWLKKEGWEPEVGAIVLDREGEHWVSIRRC